MIFIESFEPGFRCERFPTNRFVATLPWFFFICFIEYRFRGFPIVVCPTRSQQGATSVGVGVSCSKGDFRLEERTGNRVGVVNRRPIFLARRRNKRGRKKDFSTTSATKAHEQRFSTRGWALERGPKGCRMSATSSLRNFPPLLGKATL